MTNFVVSFREDTNAWRQNEWNLLPTTALSLDLIKKIIISPFFIIYSKLSRCCAARGSNTRISLVVSTKVKSCKSFPFTGKFFLLRRKNTWLILLYHFILISICFNAQKIWDSVYLLIHAISNCTCISSSLIFVT